MPSQIFNVSWFPILQVTDNGTIKPITKIIDLIRKGSHNTTDNQWNFRRTGNKRYKRRMPTVIWQASTTIRSDDAITETNGIMVVDYDHVGSITYLNILRERAKTDPSVLTAFETPRENRFKVAFLTDVTDASLYQPAYYLLLDKLKLDDVYGQFKADTSASNVSRCHFVPFDPEIHYNPDPIPIELDTLARAVPYYNAAFKASDDYLVIVLDKILEFYQTRFEGKMSVCDEYKQWISYGYALFNTFPDDEETAELYFRRFSALSPKYQKMAEGDFQTVVDSIISGKKNGNSILQIIGEARKNGYDFQYSLKDLRLELSGKFSDEGKIPPARFPLLKETQHLSDIQFDTGGNLLLESPTNTGKSEYFCKYASERRILLVPTQDLAKQLARDNSTPDHPIKAVYEGVQVTGEEDVVIGTYDSIFKLIRLDNLGEYELWIDEAQNFFLSSSTTFRNKQLTEIYESLPEFKRVVAMTGTLIQNDYLFSAQEGFEKVVIRQEGRPEKHLVLVETPDKKSSILKRLVRGTLNVIFYNDKAEGENLGKYLSKVHNFRVQLFNRDTKETEEHQAIITSRMVDKGIEVLIVTDSFKEGISINNLDFAGIHVMGSVSWVDIEQLGSRDREINPPIHMYFAQDAKFYYKYFNINASIKLRLEDAQKVANLFNGRINGSSVGSSIADLERERRIICAQEPRSPHNWVKIEDYEYVVNQLAAINEAYVQMKIAHYINVQQLLMELAPYNYKFSVETDDVEGLTDYTFNKDKMSEEKVNDFLELYGRLTVEELADIDAGDGAINEVLGRLYHITRQLRDEDVEAAFRQYGTSKQAYRTFCEGLETQLFYAKLKKEAKEPVLLKGMITSFNVGKEYTRMEVLRKLKKMQKESHLFKGVSLDSKRLVYYLRRFFQVEIIEGSGRRTSYKIASRNVTGFELDIKKIRKHATLVIDYDY